MDTGVTDSGDSTPVTPELTRNGSRMFTTACSVAFRAKNCKNVARYGLPKKLEEPAAERNSLMKGQVWFFFVNDLSKHSPARITS